MSNYCCAAAWILLLLLLLLTAGAPGTAAQQCPTPTPSPAPTIEVPLTSCANGTFQQFAVCEVKLTPSQSYTDDQAYLQMDVTATFTHKPTNTTKLVHGFYDRLPNSNQLVFKVRFNASEPGAWGYATGCSSSTVNCAGDGGLTKTGDFTVNAPTPTQPSDPGFLRRDTVYRERFVNDSGSYPFVWGQTYYHIITNKLGGGGWWTAVTNSRSRRMNKVRMLLYPYWNYLPYGDSQPFKAPGGVTDHNKLNLVHWQHFDEVVKRLYDFADGAGRHDPIIAEIILFKDPATDNHAPIDGQRTFGTQPQDERYLKYAVARYAAFPNVVWALSNEWQLTGKDAAYWNALGDILTVTPAGLPNPYDPWMFRNSKQRATSIHPNTNQLFQFYGSAWPSHAVLQFGTGNEGCVRCDGATVSCTEGDDWGNFSITNNVYRCTGTRRLRPVVNDEYGYVGDTKTKVGGFDRAKHRRAIWGIAVAGGYGSAGDLTPDPNSCNQFPTIASNWLQENAYGDIQRMGDFFTNLVPNWWEMLGQNSLVSPVTANTRVYALAKTGQYVVYAVPPAGATSATFRVSNLAAGTYTAGFYNTRLAEPLRDTVTFTVGPAPNSRDFITPDGNDWVLLIKP